MIRAFIAVNLPPDEQQVIVKLSRDLQQLPDAHLIRWVDPNALHLTLAFLGDIQEGQPAVVSAVLSEIARKAQAFSCRFAGLLAFPGWQRIRVLGIGISDPSKALHRLQADIARALRSNGFELDGRPYTPHLTLGRVRKDSPAGKVNQLADTLKTLALGPEESWQIQEIKLIRSNLGSGPPRYSILDRYHLGAQT